MQAKELPVGEVRGAEGLQDGGCSRSNARVDGCSGEVASDEAAPAHGEGEGARRVRAPYGESVDFFGSSNLSCPPVAVLRVQGVEAPGTCAGRCSIAAPICDSPPTFDGDHEGEPVLLGTESPG